MTKKKVLYFLTFWVLLGLLAVFVHGDPPKHYFYPLLPAVVILVSYLLAKMPPKILFLLAILFVVFNFSHYFSKDWFYWPQDRFIGNLVPYSMQESAAKKIIKSARGREFSLRRIGPNDKFEGDYAQNYRYLLWLYGNEPKDSSPLTFTVIESDNKITVQKN